MTTYEKNIKRLFDIVFSIVGLFMLGWVILIFGLFSKFLIKGRGFFLQKRIGQKGKIFTIYKIETMFPIERGMDENKRSRLGEFLRRTKIDELPQLFNVLKGEMSFVGPRPDIIGFADELKGEDVIILSVKPGITGPASLYFKNEEELLKAQKNPDEYNRRIIWPKKVEINKKYIKEYNFFKDIRYILKTIS